MAAGADGGAGVEVLAASDFVSVVLAGDSVALLPGRSVEAAPLDLRLSVTYQPLPLKTIAGGVSTRRACSPHTWHGC